MSMIELDSEYEDQYDAVLQKVASLEDETPELCAFWPAIGNEYEPGMGVLAIGRAVNGWGSTRFQAPDLASEERRGEVMEKARQYRSDLKWPAEREGAEGYNTRRSQFWMVLKALQERLRVPSQRSWSERLAWSNLYKVAPKSQTNPSGRLKTIQREQAGVDLLAEEIRQLQPRVAVFLTGPGWAGHFTDRMDIAWKGPEREGLAVRAGRLRDIPVVISRHPQGKRLDRWVEETSDLIAAVS